MDINLIVNITAKSWALEILAQMHQGVAGRQAALLAASGASRSSFAQSLAHLVALELLERNPGHGHPLRPEFRLTETGQTAAALAHKILETLPPRSDASLLRRNWTVPILGLLPAPRQFSQIKRGLPRITDRALSQSLTALQERRWVTRAIPDTSGPLRPLYAASNEGAEIATTILEHLA